jgi:hypothetical protein
LSAVPSLGQAGSDPLATDLDGILDGLEAVFAGESSSDDDADDEHRAIGDVGTTGLVGIRGGQRIEKKTGDFFGGTQRTQREPLLSKTDHDDDERHASLIEVRAEWAMSEIY